MDLILGLFFRCFFHKLILVAFKALIIYECAKDKILR